MAGRFFTAAAVFAAAFVSSAVAVDNSTASTFEYSDSIAVSNTPATAEYGKDRPDPHLIENSTDIQQQHY
jgi:hypothetical protein